ncbi:MAG: type II toxin-antitoxin system CcdA family antitoxin [Jannaschia sp.]
MPTRKTSLTLDADLLDEAKGYGINISAAAKEGVEAVVRVERQRRWKEENREWIEGWNRWVSKNGLPLARYRKF